MFATPSAGMVTFTEIKPIEVMTFVNRADLV